MTGPMLITSTSCVSLPLLGAFHPNTLCVIDIMSAPEMGTLKLLGTGELREKSCVSAGWVRGSQGCFGEDVSGVI